MDQLDTESTRFEDQMLFGTMMEMRSFIPGVSMFMGASMGTLISLYTSNVQTTNVRLQSKMPFWKLFRCMVGPVKLEGILELRTMALKGR